MTSKIIQITQKKLLLQKHPPLNQQQIFTLDLKVMVRFIKSKMNKKINKILNIKIIIHNLII